MSDAQMSPFTLSCLVSSAGTQPGHGLTPRQAEACLSQALFRILAGAELTCESKKFPTASPEAAGLTGKSSGQACGMLGRTFKLTAFQVNSQNWAGVATLKGTFVRC